MLLVNGRTTTVISTVGSKFVARNKVLIIAGPNGAGKSTFARRGDDFAFETTLSGRTYVNLIRDWRALDYEVKLVFLALKNAEERTRCS